MAKKSEFRLLGTAASPFVNRVQFVLNLKGIKYDYIEENLASKSELLLTSNPVHKKVPVLLHADKPPICDSLVIVNYLDELKPDVLPLFPSDALSRANTRFWANFLETKFFPLFEKLRRTLDKEGKDAIKNQIKEATKLLEETFIKFSNGKAYFGGDDIGYLDVIFACFITWIKYIDKLNYFNTFDENRIPELAKWAKHISSHEALKSITPDNEILDKFFMLVHVYKPPYQLSMRR